MNESFCKIETIEFTRNITNGETTFIDDNLLPTHNNPIKLGECADTHLKELLLLK